MISAITKWRWISCLPNHRQSAKQSRYHLHVETFNYKEKNIDTFQIEDFSIMGPFIMKGKGLNIDRIYHNLMASSCQNALANRLPYLVNHEPYSSVTDTIPLIENVPYFSHDKYHICISMIYNICIVTHILDFISGCLYFKLANLSGLLYAKGWLMIYHLKQMFTKI